MFSFLLNGKENKKGEARRGKARQGKARRGWAWRGEAWQGGARHGLVFPSMGFQPGISDLE
jgi:hypothetical protein